MKVLWVTNIAPPSFLRFIRSKPVPLGSWFVSMARELTRAKTMELSIAFPWPSLRHCASVAIDGVTYYPFHSRRAHNARNPEPIEDLLRKSSPELVHIHGTELPHSRQVMRTATQAGIPTVLGIQGLVSIIAHHVGADLPRMGIRDLTIRSLLRRDTIRGLEHLYRRLGRLEKETLAMADHVIGRTEWDLACATLLAPQAVYHHVNEILREDFYSGAWSAADCFPHTVFVSQGANPLKGLHHVVEACSLLLPDFPDLHVHVTGRIPVEGSWLSQHLIGTQYGAYLRRLILRSGMTGHITFHGYRSAEQVKALMLACNVFVSASSIENESNALSEAKSLGVPAIGSFVGGVTSRIDHGRSGFLYQHDAPYMLAHYLRLLFTDRELAHRLGSNARIEASETNDPATNLNALLAVYQRVIADETLRGNG